MTVTVAGVVTIVTGVLGILSGVGLALLIALFGVFIGEISEGKSPGSGAEAREVFLPLAAVVLVVVVGISAAYLVLGVRVLRRGPVARVLLTVWAGLLLAAVLGMSVWLVVAAVSGSVDSVGPGTIAGVVGALPLAATVVCLWTGGASEWFARRGETVRR